MVITSRVKCLGQCLPCNRGESNMCAHTFLFSHLRWVCCLQACVCVLQHALESQYQGGNWSRGCQTGAQRELWCLNGGSVLPVSLVTLSVGTKRGLPVSACGGCWVTAAQEQNTLITPISSITSERFLFQIKDFTWSRISSARYVIQ